MKTSTIARAIVVAYLAVSAMASGQEKVERIRQLSFQLTENRIVPAQIEVPKGKYIIRLSNGVSRNALRYEFVKSGADAAKLADKNVRAGKSRDEAYVDLQPGSYIMRVVGQAKWTASVTVK